MLLQTPLSSNLSNVLCNVESVVKNCEDAMVRCQQNDRLMSGVVRNTIIENEHSSLIFTYFILFLVTTVRDIEKLECFSFRKY